jgi:hypothetical protein
MAGSWSVQTNRVDTSLYSDVGCDSREPLWLMAQAVPSASLVPCVQLVPVGWSLAAVKVQDGYAHISFDTDRAGGAAVVVDLTASCDLAGATEVSSERSGARRYLRVDRNSTEASATRIYTFPGGCVTQRYRGAGSRALRLSDTASTEFGFVTRQALRQELSQRSGGRLKFDPAAR